jgi:hypothetical protein
MAGETLIHGKEGILYIYDTSAFEPIACLTSNSIATALSVLESNTKCDPGNTVRTADQFSYDISCDGELIDTTSATGDATKTSWDKLLALQMAKTNVTWKLDAGLADTTYYGTAIISDLNLDQSATEISTFSATLTGSGAIVTTDPTT